MNVKLKPFSKNVFAGLFLSLACSQVSAITLSELQEMTHEEQGEYFRSLPSEQYKSPNYQCNDKYKADVKSSVPTAKEEYNACVVDDAEELMDSLFTKEAARIYRSRSKSYSDRIALGYVVADMSLVLKYMLQSDYPVKCTFDVYEPNLKPSSWAVDQILNIPTESTWVQSPYQCPDLEALYRDEIVPKLVPLLEPVVKDLITYRNEKFEYDELEKQREAQEKQARIDAIKQKQLDLQNGKLKPQNFDEVLFMFNKRKRVDGDLILRPQAYRSFENAYLSGSFDSGNIDATFMGKAQGRMLRGGLETGYFEVIVTDKTQVLTELQPNQPIYKVHVVGDYVRYKQYTTVSGQTRYMPVIEAKYLSY